MPTSRPPRPKVLQRRSHRRANLLGQSDKAGYLGRAHAQTQGDINVITGQAWPEKVSGQRDKQIGCSRKDGFTLAMEVGLHNYLQPLF